MINNNANPEPPDLPLILAAYAVVANRVAAAVVRGGPPDLMDVSLLASLSAAVRVIGSEYHRQVLSRDVAQDAKTGRYL